MSDCINFARAKALTEVYGKNLLENYDYKFSRDNWICPITRDFKIEKIEKINNPQLFGMYLLWEEEFKNSDLYSRGSLQTLTLYHATSPSNAKEIARSNIDWRKTYRSKYGIGSCFSDCPVYANRHASSTGAFVIFEVLTKKIEHVGNSYSLKVPKEKECDTTLSDNKRVYVKYDDYQFYPKFIVYYNK